MKKSKVILCLGLICLLCLSACAEADASGESEEITVDEAETGESASAGEETEQTGTELEEAEQAGTGSSEEPMRLNFTRFDNLPEAAKQVGYSFRALEKFADSDVRFHGFDISEKKQEVNGMELTESYPVVTLHYENGIRKIDMIIFPYDGQNIQSSIRQSICDVSTCEINGIDVHLTEYILCMVSEDYEMTEEDWEFMNSGKGSFSCDFVSEGETYYRTLYWIEDGIYYEMNVREDDVPTEEIEQWVLEYMNAELQ